MRSLGSRATALPSLSRPRAIVRLAGSRRSTADAFHEYGGPRSQPLRIRSGNSRSTDAATARALRVRRRTEPLSPADYVPPAMTHEIAVIPGDGIGQEVTPAAVEVLEAIDAVDFDFVEGAAGDAVKAETGEALPEETRDLAADATRRCSARPARRRPTSSCPSGRSSAPLPTSARPARIRARRRPARHRYRVHPGEHRGVYKGIESEISEASPPAPGSSPRTLPRKSPSTASATRRGTGTTT